MRFKPGDVVRYKGDPKPLTVLWHEEDNGVDTVCYQYFNSDGAEEANRVTPGALELVPAQALKRLEKIKNRSGIGNFIKDHPLIIYLSFGIVAFVAGFQANNVIRESRNQVLVTRDSYTLNSNIDTMVRDNYVDKRIFEDLREENKQLKSVVSDLSNNNTKLILDQINKRKAEKEEIYSKLENIRSRNSPMVAGAQREISTEEQDALNRIDEINQEIALLYQGIN